MDFFLDIGERFNEKERGYVAGEEVIEPCGFVRVDALEKRLVKGKRRPARHYLIICG
jgi:hypothetical protein